MKTKNLQPDQKIFFLGLNKNATTTFYHFFNKNGYKCEDSTIWWGYQTKEQFGDREVFTDGYEKKYRNTDEPIFTAWPYIKFLNRTFPNSYYILQTRPMKDWLLSRQLKYATSGGNLKDVENIMKSIHEDYVLRLYWHRKVEYYSNVLFSQTKSQFMCLDISHENSKIVSELEQFLKVSFTDKQLVEKNKTTWIDSDRVKFFENLVIRYLEQRKYEI
jgi:hypothetical protein